MADICGSQATAKSCCCQLLLPLARQACQADGQSRAEQTPLQCQSTKCWQACSTAAFPIPTFSASGREDFRNSPNFVRCTYNGNCAETASYSTLDSQDMDRQARHVVFLASEANFHASQFFEARLTGRKCCCSLPSWFSTTASFKSTVDAVA